MPPKSEKGRTEAKEVAAFVRRLYEESGFTSWGEFARSAGVSPATMSDWKRAENAPSGYSLLKLIRASRWSSNGKTAPDLPGSFEEKADEMLAGIADILALLDHGEDDAAAPKATPR